MKMKEYSEAVQAIKVSALKTFLVEQGALPEDWDKLLPGGTKKRERMMQMLKANEALRGDFVAFYQKTVDGEAPNFAFWEEKAAPAGTEEEASQAEYVPIPDDGTGVPKYAPPNNVPAEDGNQTGGEMDVPEEGEQTSIPGDTLMVPAASVPLSGVTTASTPSVIVEGYFDQVSSDVAGLSPADALTALQVIEESKEESYFRMGALVSHMKKTEAHAALGYENLRALIADQTHLEYRTAMYLATNYEKVVELGIPSKKLTGIGWTKLRDVLPYMTPDNYNEWLKKARTLQKSALYNAISEEKKKALPSPASSEGDDGGTPAGPVQEAKTKGFSLYGDQATVVEQAISKAKIEANTDAQGAALAAMAAAYLGQPVVKSVDGPDTSEGGMKALGKALKDNESSYGEGFITLLNALSEFWPDLDVNVNFPE